MTCYELSISSEYVPSWGVVEAIREFFQNALDEETRDPANKMFFSYDADTETLSIGNKHGKLDAKTLLLGYTEKNTQDEMIGNHGEGYKIATVVLLRLNKQITFYNYGNRQIWKPRFVNSRKYKALVPTFFVEKKPLWESIPDNDLVITIEGITIDEYSDICESNLHLVGGDYKKIHTEYGDLLLDDKYAHKVFVGGLFICDSHDIDLGMDILPSYVKLERDRSMVNSFDVQWYMSKMIEQSGDYDLISASLDTPVGNYIYYRNIPNQGDRIAEQFLKEYGFDAVPVADQENVDFCKSTNTVVVSKVMRDIILESRYYKEHFTCATLNPLLTSTKLIEFAEKIKSKLLKDELIELSNILREVRKLEGAKEVDRGDI